MGLTAQSTEGPETSNAVRQEEIRRNRICETKNSLTASSSDPSWAQDGLRAGQECYLLGNRNFESCLSPLRFRCFLSITTEYMIRRTRRPVWVSRYDSHLGSHPAVLISDTLSSSRAFFLNLITRVSFPPSFPLSTRFFISPPTQLPSKTPAIEPLSVHGKSNKTPAKRKRDPQIKPITITDRDKAGTSPPEKPHGIKNETTYSSNLLRRL